jgi:hypothetical protein
MAFRVKDLIINIAPGKSEKPLDRETIFEGIECHWSITDLIFSPVSRRLGCPAAVDCDYFEAEITGAQRAALKAQLQKALAEIENQEKAAAKSWQPKTVGEVEELEHKLTEALAELKQLKSNIERNK